MFRYERPQRGRYRQFQQCGVELLGDSSPSADVEVIGLADRFLQELWVGQSETADTKRRPFELRLNTLGDGERCGGAIVPFDCPSVACLISVIFVGLVFSCFPA